jgi:hypothetical protein
MGKFRNEIGVHPEQGATYVGTGHFLYAPTSIFAPRDAGLVGDSITSATAIDVGFAVKASGSIFPCATATSVYLNRTISIIYPLFTCPCEFDFFFEKSL